MVQHANNAANRTQNDSSDEVNAILDRMASEISIVTTIASSFSEAFDAQAGNIDSQGCIKEGALTVLQRAWPIIHWVAEEFNFRKVSLQWTGSRRSALTRGNVASDTGFGFCRKVYCQCLGDTLD
jgi:hypothetical protein